MPVNEGTVVYESRGNGVDVTLISSVRANSLVYAEGWFGVTSESAASGEQVALSIQEEEYQFEVPAALAVAKGQVVFAQFSAMSGSSNVIPDAAYNTTGGTGHRALFRATQAKDANNIVVGKLIANLAV